jgi:pyruvate dehydrogenase E1 component beta subunit
MYILCFRYGESFPVSAESLDSSFCLPIGKAKVTLRIILKMIVPVTVILLCSHYNVILVHFVILYCSQIEREGKDVTITAFSKMVGYALKVCLPYLLQMFISVF